MTETIPPPPTPPPASLRRDGPFALLAAGGEALRTVPGLSWFLIKGFLLLYLLFAALGAVVTTLTYVYAVAPLLDWAAGNGEPLGWWAELLHSVVLFFTWIVQGVLLGASLLLAFVVALVMMSVWFEALAERILRHRRGGATPEGGFSLAAWVGSILSALRDGIWLVVLVVASLALGFVPVAGPFLVFAVTCYVLGWEVREPYIAVRVGLGDDRKALRRGLSFWTLRVGALPALLTMIPVVGWVLLPLAMTRLVAGVAWSSEQPQSETAP